MHSPDSARASAPDFGEIPALLRGEAATILPWIEHRSARRILFAVALICAGAGLYGAAMGWWRSPRQARFTAIKLPLVLLLTTLGNALRKGMLAPLLGLNLSFRQSTTAILLSFAITATVLGALSPIAAFVVWNTPSLTAATRLTSLEYGFLQLMLVTFIAFAGVVGNIRLVPLLQGWGAAAGVARRVLLAWLAVNLLLGSQISWVLRPFLWDPARPVEFVGPEYLRGSFYETIFDAAMRLLALWKSTR